MMGASGRLARGGLPTPCPACQQATIRFYYHEFRQEPRRSGTLWLWCAACRTWDTVSRIELPRHVRYADPYAALTTWEFEGVERDEFLSNLDRMWDERAIPRDFER